MSFSVAQTVADTVPSMYCTYVHTNVGVVPRGYPVQSSTMYIRYVDVLVNGGAPFPPSLSVIRPPCLCPLSYPTLKVLEMHTLGISVPSAVVTRAPLFTSPSRLCLKLRAPLCVLGISRIVLCSFCRLLFLFPAPNDRDRDRDLDLDLGYHSSSQYLSPSSSFPNRART